MRSRFRTRWRTLTSAVTKIQVQKVQLRSNQLRIERLSTSKRRLNRISFKLGESNVDLSLMVLASQPLVLLLQSGLNLKVESFLQLLELLVTPSSTPIPTLRIRSSPRKYFSNSAELVTVVRSHSQSSLRTYLSILNTRSIRKIGIIPVARNSMATRLVLTML